MESRYTQNQNMITQQGTQLNNEAIAGLGYYGDLTPQYQTQEDAALSNLNAQPGYTPSQAAQINTDYSQFTTPASQQAGEMGNASQPVQVLNQGNEGTGAMLGQYQSDLSGQLQNNQTGVQGAVAGLSTGLSNAQDFGKLNTAVDNPNLAFDPNSTEKQMTDQDVQNMVTAAGTQVGSQYRSAEDQLQQQATAAGNSSPLAIAAANARLQQQSAVGSANAMTSADIAAEQAQATRAQGIEAQREGAVQTQAGMQATAGTTEEAAAQAAAGLAGQTGVSAEENIGAADLNAANQYGQYSTTTANTLANQNYGAASTAEQLAASRAQTLANQNYTQGTGAAQNTAAGAEAVGNAQIAGQGAYRSGVAGQESFAQQGGQAAQSNQQQTYATQTGGINNSASSQGNFALNKPSLGDTVAKTAATGALGLVGLDKGGVVTEPTTAKIAENGPEMVVQLGRYKNKRDPQEAFRGWEAA